MINVEPDNLVKVSSKSYSTKEHDSMRIDEVGWNWFSKGIGGRSAYSYLEIVKKLDFKSIMDILHDLSINENKVSYNILDKDYQLPDISTVTEKLTDRMELIKNNNLMDTKKKSQNENQNKPKINDFYSKYKEKWGIGKNKKSGI